MKRWLQTENKEAAKPNSLKADCIVSNQIISRHLEGFSQPITDDISVKLRYQSWPTVCKGEKDTLYVVSSMRLIHFDPLGCTAFYQSKDAGKTWSKTRIILDTPLDDRDTGIVYLGDGKLLVTSFTADAWKYVEGGPRTYWQTLITEEQKGVKLHQLESLSQDQRLRSSYIITSEDYGTTWSEPKRIPVSCPHGPTLMNDGKTLLYFGDVHCDPDRCEGFTADQFRDGYFHLIESPNFGKTWSYRASVELPVIPDFIFDEPHAIQLDDGSFLGVIRGQSITGKYDTFRVFITYSEDGYTWTLPKEIEGIVGSPPHLVQLSNSVVVLSYSSRIYPTGARARLSYDGGKTWGEEITLSVSADPEDPDLGYSSTAELEDGSLITTYYQHAENDKFPSLLYTTWKLVPKTDV